MNLKDLAAEIHAELESLGTPERAGNEKRYLKSDLKHYGVKVPVLRKCARDFLKRNPKLGHDALVELVGELWDSGWFEARMAAVELLNMRRKLLGPQDMELMERLLRDSHTWALVDNLAASGVGGLVDKHPELKEVLDRWSVDDDFWLRRSAMLALLGELRQGRGDWERFTRYADAMLEEKEFFIRKVIGWVLRDTSRKRPDMVYEWIASRTDRASGVTVREAVRHLTDEQRDAVMSAYNEKRPVA